MERPMGENSRLERYKRIRETSLELTGQMMKHIPKYVLTRAARELNLTRRGVIVFDSEAETSFLMDRCFYDIFWQGKNLIRHFIESEHYDELTEEERTIVEGMAGAYYSLFEVLNLDYAEASLELADVLGEGTYTITDVNMSESAVPGILLATRIKQTEGIWLTTGAACPFRGEQKELLLEGLRPKRAAVKSGKKRRRTQELQRTDYSAHFFREYRRISDITFSTEDTIES